METTANNDIEQLKAEIEAFGITDMASLEAFRQKYLAKKGLIAIRMAAIKNIAPEQRRAYGAMVNALKELAEQKWRQAKADIESKALEHKPTIDLSLPPLTEPMGTYHPLTIVRRRIVQILERMGFCQADGPEIEDDFHNFTGLNFPADHPAREMQDTFFLSSQPDMLLRTHTSSVQIRVMRTHKPPMRQFSIGRVYRNEAISARAHCIFHQIEGFFVDENVSFADLKQTLYHFARELFGQDTQIRLRPSFFPFTEPSAELDISCNICKGKGCNICKYSGWVEIGGAGMIHPCVFEHCNIDSEQYTGFAFGMGLERITMLKYQIRDLRLFTENDWRFLNQFVGLR